ncbi:hypothetical protein LDFHOB_04180 [Candidatus Electronema aureum]
MLFLVQGDGVRFRLPLRDSPGFSPDSLLAALLNSAGQRATLPMKRTDSHYDDGYFIWWIQIGQALNDVEAGKKLRYRPTKSSKVFFMQQRIGEFVAECFFPFLAFQDEVIKLTLIGKNLTTCGEFLFIRVPVGSAMNVD